MTFMLLIHAPPPPPPKKSIAGRSGVVGGEIANVDRFFFLINCYWSEVLDIRLF